MYSRPKQGRIKGIVGHRGIVGHQIVGHFSP